MANKKEKSNTKGAQLILIFTLLIYGLFTLKLIVVILTVIWLYLDYKQSIKEDQDNDYDSY